MIYVKQGLPNDSMKQSDKTNAWYKALTSKTQMMTMTRSFMDDTKKQGHGLHTKWNLLIRHSVVKRNTGPDVCAQHLIEHNKQNPFKWLLLQYGMNVWERLFKRPTQKIVVTIRLLTFKWMLIILICRVSERHVTKREQNLLVTRLWLICFILHMQPIATPITSFLRTSPIITPFFSTIHVVYHTYTLCQWSLTASLGHHFTN